MDNSAAYRTAMLATLVLGLPGCAGYSASALLSNPFAAPAQAAERSRPSRATERGVGLVLNHAVDTIADGFRRNPVNR